MTSPRPLASTRTLVLPSLGDVPVRFFRSTLRWAEQVAFFRRICNLSSGNTRERCHFVWLRQRISQNFEHSDSTSYQGVGNKRTMTAPWHSLGTHQSTRFLAGELNRVVESGFEFRGLHVVRKPAKTGIAPSGVGRIAPRVTQPPKLLHVEVIDLRVPQALGQGVCVKLRIVPGLWNCPNVD